MNIKKNKEKIIKIFDLVKKSSKKRFIESIDVDINLLLDYKDISQNICGNLLFPYRNKNKRRIVVFTDESNFKIAYKAGAFFVGNNDLFDKIKNNKIKYDLVICSYNYINIVSKLGYILGPKGLMPNLKLGTITNDIKNTVSDFVKGKVIYKSDKYGIIHISIGKINFSNEELFSNFFYLINSILLNKLNKVDNDIFIKKISVSSTMGKSYIINLN